MIDLEIEAEAWSAADPHIARIGVQAERALAAWSGWRARSGAGSDVTVLLTDDDTVADLNARFRGKSGPTNVLAFAAAANRDDHLGDIALAFGVCAREAVDQDKALSDHAAHLVLHGVLHLLGYDHQSDADAEGMEEIERALLASLGIADPYGPERIAVTQDRGDHG